MTDRTNITRELDQLIQQQIHIFKRDAKISDPELSEYSQRSQRIRSLCRALNPGAPQTSADN